MGKRSAVVELFLGDMGSIQRETRPSIQREDQLTMETKLEQIAASAVKQLPKSVGAGNPHATFCGNRGRATASGDPVGVETGTTGELVRHRQTKGAATDMFNLQPLRHTSTLPKGGPLRPLTGASTLDEQLTAAGQALLALHQLGCLRELSAVTALNGRKQTPRQHAAFAAGTRIRCSHIPSCRPFMGNREAQGLPPRPPGSPTQGYAAWRSSRYSS